MSNEEHHRLGIENSRYQNQNHLVYHKLVPNISLSYRVLLKFIDLQAHNRISVKGRKNRVVDSGSKICASSCLSMKSAFLFSYLF